MVKKSPTVAKLGSKVDGSGLFAIPNSVKSVFIHPRFFLYGSETSTVILGYTLNYEDRNGGDMQALNKSLNTSKSLKAALPNAAIFGISPFQYS